jgi:transcriptional antiterminator RfaH
MDRWYVVHTHANAEQKAAWHLQRQGFGIYLPRYLRQRRHARRVDSVARPLFPRYLFVAMDLAVARWRAIRSSIGVSDLICQGDRPSPVPETVIDEIRRRENDSGLVLLPPPTMQRGEEVRIVDGALQGVTGLFECASDGERGIILLDLLGRQVRARVPLDTVTAAA